MLVDAELCFPLKISEKLKSTEWAKKEFIKAWMCVQYTVDVFIVISNSYVVCGKYLVWQCAGCAMFHIPYWQISDRPASFPGGWRPKKYIKRGSYLFAVVKLGEWDLAERLERLAVNATVATVLGSIPASSDTVEWEGWQKKQCEQCT